MAEFYLVNEDFCVPLKDDDDILDLESGDIIEMRFLKDNSSLIKKAGDLEFLDCHLYYEFIVANYHIFERITIAYIRDQKILSLIKKSNKC